MRRLLALLSITGAFFLPAAPAGACSCAMLEPVQMLEFAPTAFVGTIVGSTPVGVQPMADQALTFEVETVLAGEVAAEVEVITANNSAACGIDATIGTRLAVFATPDGDQLTSNLCSVTDADLAIAALGPGTPPVADGSSSSGSGLDWQALWLGAGGLVVVAGAWWLSRRH
ncbi:MAG TPA: hypothetical protein VIA81_06050 [Acidimicrobiia bacterium]